jgi:hypothetical protein
MSKLCVNYKSLFCLSAKRDVHVTLNVHTHGQKGQCGLAQVQAWAFTRK